MHYLVAVFLALFVAGGALARPSAASHGPRSIPFGVYVGNPNGNDAASMAVFQRQWDASVRPFARRPRFFESFVDYGQDWKDWPSNAGWMAWSWRQSKRSDGLLPVIGIKLSTNAYWNRQQDAFRELIAGQHDEVYRGVAIKWRDAGFRELRFRISYEFNGNFMPDNFGKDDATLVLWRRAFAHVADILHGVPGVKILVVWNPASINWAAHPVGDAYPGDQYVDVIASDLYSRVYPLSLRDWTTGHDAPDAAAWAASPANRIHFWNHPGATEWSADSSGWGLVQALAFALAHRKPFAISETGIGSVGPATGPADDPYFSAYLRARLDSFSRGGGTIDHVIIWDYNASDGAWRFTGVAAKAATAAAWRAFVGMEQDDRGVLPRNDRPEHRPRR